MIFQALRKIEEGSKFLDSKELGIQTPSFFSKGPAPEPPSSLLFLAFVLANLTEVFGMVISKHQQT